MQFICRATLVATDIRPLGLLGRENTISDEKESRNKCRITYLRTVEVIHCEGIGLSVMQTFLTAA